MQPKIPAEFPSLSFPFARNFARERSFPASSCQSLIEALILALFCALEMPKGREVRPFGHRSGCDCRLRLQAA
jgi:hypothetical protein